MKQQKWPLFYLLLFSAIILLLFLVMQFLQVLHFQNYIAILFPKGIIALEERNLLLFIQVLMLLVVIPVYIFTFIFSWKYRADNKKAIYDPHLTDNWIAECFWWGIPLVLTIIIGGITWVKTHELDPFRPIDTGVKPLQIQVVALQWKWLFIYPQEKIAAVNFLQIPKDRPVHFQITADAPMNSFWIPHLAGQIYAMPAMQTELHLIANEVGDFRGSSANISGEGFASMHFIARASTEKEYESWIAETQKSHEALSWDTYSALAAPSQNNPETFYKLEDDMLFKKIIHKYMHPPKKG